jgi:Kef-type K+ transport system membrane component KefB
VLVGGALLFAAAVAGKFGSAAPVACADGMPGRAALGLGVLMNARGVTEIVVLSTGLSTGGGFHCCNLDVRRRGDLVTYLNWRLANGAGDLPAEQRQKRRHQCDSAPRRT